MATTLDLLRHLHDARVDFVVVGGMAGVAHGSSMVTRDVDVCAEFTEANMARLLVALEGLDPKLGRGTRARRLSETAAELASSPEISLQTNLGPLDVVPDVPAVGAWPAVSAASETFELGAGLTCRVLGLDALIASKRALARTRDLLAVEELEEIRRRLRDG